MPTTTISAPLVGSHFRPPAKQVLAVLPTGCALALVPEPENPYDEKAIRVMLIPAETIPVGQVAALATALAGTGFDALDLIGSSEPLHLGYIGDSDGKVCKQRQCPGNREVGAMLATSASTSATLGFDPDGQAMVLVVAGGEEAG
jgi:hypothetical protein